MTVETVSINAAQRWQQDTDNNSDSPNSAFGLSVTTTDQQSTMCSQPDDESQSSQHNGSCETKVCTKSAAPCAPEVGQKIVRASAGPTICRDDFEYWVDEFLSIPIDEYLKIDKCVLANIDDSYCNYVKTPGICANTITLMKVKHLLNRSLRDWQLKQNREQTRKQLMSLHRYTRGKRDLTWYVRNLVFMKHFKDMLYGREVSNDVRQQFLAIINDVLYTLSIVGEGYYPAPYLDVISLGVAYFVGGLPGFEDDANYEKSFKLMHMHQRVISGNAYLFFSPVSFTALDYMRFCPKDISQKLDDQKKMLPGRPVITVMQVIASYVMLGEDEAFPKWLGKEQGFNSQTYLSVRNILDSFSDIIEVIANKGKRSKELPALKDNLFSQMQQCEKLTSASKDNFPALFNLLRAQIILSEKELQPRLRYAKVASLFANISERSPSHWSTAYSFYCLAGIWGAAATAAQHYVRYWQDKDPTVAEYWSDRYSRELQADGTSQHDQSPGKAEQQYDMDTILREFAGEPAPEKPVPKKTKPRQKKIATEPGAGRNLSQTPPRQPETASCPGRPVIKALPYGINLPDGLMGEYHIKGPQGAIRPFEKLLSRHWNPLVKKTLNLIRAARNDCDLTQERSIYHKLLNSPKLKTCIGIERIWEEYAWTELHQFDDCFRMRAMPESMRPEAQKWITTARNSYIMPSLAHCLGLDQICTLIEPEAVWEAVIQLVEQPELAEPDVNQEIRFRLRCLFSSIGHTYSLGAMINPGQSQQLMEVARKWYSFKTIDPKYDQSKGLVLQ